MDYNSNVHYIEDPSGFGEFVGVDLDGIEHYGATETICRDRISDANRVIAKHQAANTQAQIEKILGDTQGKPRRQPSGIFFIECGDLCHAGK